MRSFILLVAVVLLGACNHGLRPVDFAPSQSPRGATITLDFAGARSAKGELFAVDTQHIVVLLDHLTRVAWSDVQAARTEQLDFSQGLKADASRAERVARLRLLSRFPQGLEGELLSRVLRFLEQDSIVSFVLPAVVAPSPRSPRESGSADPPGVAEDLDRFADGAAAQARRFTDRRVAIAAGYRRLGADFPGMGEHWLDAGALLAGTLDAARPAVLSYADIGGAPRLVGLGFVVTTTADELARVPGWPQHWHEHSGPFADESGAAPSRGDTRSQRGTRVWILHVWSPFENPEGRYVPDNWALPFARLGLAPPERPDPRAARALALASGSDVYWKGVMTDARVRHDGNAGAIDALIAEARAEVIDLIGPESQSQGVAAPTPPRTLSSVQLTALERSWRTLSERLRLTAGEDVIRLLAPPHDHLRNGEGQP